MMCDVVELQEVYRRFANDLGALNRVHAFAVDAYGEDHVSAITNEDDESFLGSDDDGFRTWHFTVRLCGRSVSVWAALRDTSTSEDDPEESLGIYMDGDYQHYACEDGALKRALRCALFDVGED